MEFLFLRCDFDEWRRHDSKLQVDDNIRRTQCEIVFILEILQVSEKTYTSRSETYEPTLFCGGFPMFSEQRFAAVPKFAKKSVIITSHLAKPF